LILDIKTKGYDYENHDAFCRMVHIIRALLAHRLACIDSFSLRLAFVFAAAANWHLYWGCIRINSYFTIFAGPFARMEAS
jgi:hypothetical protein